MPYVNSKEQLPLITLRTIRRYEGRLLFSPTLITDNFGLKLHLRIHHSFGAGMFFRNSSIHQQTYTPMFPGIRQIQYEQDPT
jgi:hypothetical protein